MSKAPVLLSFFGLIVLISGCKSTRELSRETDLLRKADEVYKQTRQENLDYSYLSLRASVSIKTDKQKISFSSLIRMKQDSAVWVSVSFLGIAGAKALITQDSALLINYRDRTYTSEPYNRVEDLLNTELLSLSALQHLLVGNMIELSDFDKLHLKLEDQKYLLTTLSDRKIDKDWVEKKLEKREKKKDRIDDKKPEKVEKKLNRRPVRYDEQTVEYWIDPVMKKVEKIMIKDYALNGEIKTVYSDFRKLGERQVPYHILLELLSERDIAVEIIYSKITREEHLKMPISIPEKYERIKM